MGVIGFLMDDSTNPGGVVDLSLISTFLAVYRAGSLTGAAPQLGLSQPTVTAQIKTLEAQLGQQLFERGPRGVAPTLAADELAAQVALHIDAVTAATQRSIAGDSPFASSVHLGGPAEMTAMRALPSLAHLVNQGLRLRVTLGLAEDLLAGLPTGRYDIVVSTIRPRGASLVGEPLFREEFVLVAAPSTAKRVDQRRLAEDPVCALSGLRLIAYSEHLPIVRRYWRHVFGQRPGQNIAVVVPDLRGVLAMVAAGAGASVLPHYLCAAELANGDLVPLVTPEAPPTNTVYLVTRSGATAFPHIAAVREWLLREARTW
jgi:DNA-binding transcriptional LysR family regulator